MTSFTNNATEYLIDTEKLTCTCPDFDRRKYRSRSDPKRLCKHLIQVLNRQERDEGAATGLDYITDTVLGRPVQAKIKTDSPWVDVTYDGERHGFNTERRYWTHSARELPEFEELDQWIKQKI